MRIPCISKMAVAAGFLLGGCLYAEDFRTWTRADGKTAELQLVSVAEEGGEKVGVFRMRDGRTARIKASVLGTEDAAVLASWQAAAAEVAAPASVFDKWVDGDLVRLEGKSLRTVKDFQKPTKYYLFYYTASWCGPCQKFTPSLVEFYEKHKAASKEFELILVTSDRDEESMEEYARSKKMPWPQLKLSKVEKFREEVDHPGRGIPNLVLTDLQGNILKASYEGETYVGPQSVMRHLATLLDGGAK